MDSTTIVKKLTTLGYDNNFDYLSSFDEIVFKLEDDYINLYLNKKREKFKSTKGTEWFKLFRSYCNELNLDTSDDFFNRNQLSDKQKEFVLNKLLNVSINKKYEKLSKDNTPFESPTSSDHDTIKNTDDYKFHMDKLNFVLEKLNLPLLNSNSRASELKSSLDLYLKLNSSGKSGTSDGDSSNQSLMNGSSRAPDGSESLENVNKNNFRSLYTEDLCKLQSEIIWLTKEFSKLPTVK